LRIKYISLLNVDKIQHDINILYYFVEIFEFQYNDKIYRIYVPVAMVGIIFWCVNYCDLIMY